MALTKFVLSVDLGNAAMQTKDDVADALMAVAKRIRREGSDQRADKHSVTDLNGNSCGQWSFE